MPITNSVSLHSTSNSLFEFILKFPKNKSLSPKERRQIWLAVIFVTAGVFLSLAASLAIKAGIDRDEKNEFDFACKEINNAISTRLYAHAQLLRSKAAFFVDTDGITREEWRNSYNRQMIEKNLPGIQGVGYSAIILPDQLALHEKIIRAEGFPDYTVRPKGKREIYTSIIYLEPFSGRNLRAFGYDMFSEPVRREAMEKARDHNIVSISGKITLVQESNEDIQAGTLMYVPVYKQDMPVGTIEERRRAIQGWVYSPYRMNDLMAGILGGYETLIERHLRLEIYDNSTYNQDALLYDSRKVLKEITESSFIFSQKTSISFNDYKWFLKYTQYDAVSSSLGYSNVWFFGIGGTSISILLFLLYMALVTTNIRANKKAEELTRDLNDSERRHSAMISNIQDVIGIVGADGFIKYTSSNIEKWFGWNKQEIEGTDSWLIVHPDDLERVQKEFFTLMGNDKSQKRIELRYKCKDGSYKPILLAATNLINDPVINGVLLNYHDITERKKAESKLQDVIEKNPMSIQILDKDGYTLSVNSAHTRLFGAVPPPDHSMFSDFQIMQQGLDELMKQAKNGEVVRLPDAYYNAHDLIPEAPDVFIWVSAVIFPIKDKYGKPEQFVLMHENITERKQAEKELLETKEKLEKTNAEKDQFFSVLAHDLKGPFQGFLGLTELFAENIRSFPRDELLNFSKAMNTSAKTLFKLLDNLLTWAQINKGGISLTPANLSLRALFSHNFDIIEQSLKRKEISFLNKIPESLQVHADEIMINSVARNLLSNALKFSKPGGKIIVSAGETEKDMIEIAVSDSGIGMGEELCKKLFTVGERVGREGTEGEKSSGLGLIICKEFVEMHDGKIWADSKENTGSTFYFTLPKVKSDVK